MKNSIKKVLCTALAAVSLSALVTVPSSLNVPNSDNAIVNFIEAEAANAKQYTAYMTKGKNYYIRTTPNKDVTWNIAYYSYPYDTFDVYSVEGNWVRITPDNAAKKLYVYKSRTERKQSSPHSENGNEKYTDWISDSKVFRKNKGDYTINYEHVMCKICCSEYSPRIIRIEFIPNNGGKKQTFYSLSDCPDKIKESELKYKRIKR